MGRGTLFNCTTAALLLAAPLAAQTPDLTFGGQVRPRSETRKPVNGSWDAFTSMRVRAALNAVVDPRVRLFMQVQDVRLWGGEANTLTDYSADNFDLHQGYVEVGRLPWVGGLVRAGRQEVSFGDQRLVGSVNWSQQGRAFDGLRYSRAMGEDASLDLVALQTAENSAAAHTVNGGFFGAYAAFRSMNAGAFDGYGYLNTTSGGNPTRQATLGGRWRSATGPLSWRAEASYQFGKRNGADVSAYMLGLEGTYGFLGGMAGVTGWYDYLSGDPDPGVGTVKVFSTLYATNHPYYGLYDLFTNIPVQTQGLGLQDPALKLFVRPRPGAAAHLDLHAFSAARRGSLTTRRLANEVDLALDYRVSPALGLSAGYSYVHPLDGIREMGTLNRDGGWGWLMLDASF